MNLHERLNRLEKAQRMKGAAPRYLVEALEKARAANGDTSPLPDGLDFLQVYTMLIEAMPN